jgi:hypothetical protein
MWSAATTDDQDFSRSVDRKKNVRNRIVLVSLCSLAVVAGCAGEGRPTFHDGEGGLTFRYPRSWSVTGFSHTNSPRRLVAASYQVKPSEVEGDCGGIEALRSLPASGAAVLLIDYGSTSSFAPHSGGFTLSEFKRANFECFGDSYMLRFSRGGHDLQAHVALGSRASADRRRQALSILDSLTD